ncbi:MAG: hypothetical protein EXR71_07435 [Myxococcales bacterium]|nr:hypothetical protein [Myxococcales bacterium]
MSLRTRLDRALGLGPSDEPRPIAVAARRARVNIPLVSTPGGRVRINRTHHSGELGRLLLWLHRNRVPVELMDGDADEVWVDGEAVSTTEARRRLS